MVSRRLRVRGADAAGGGRGPARHGRGAARDRQPVRRRLLDADSLHLADVHGGDIRLCRRDLAALRPPDRPPDPRAENRRAGGGLRRPGLDDLVLLQLGAQPRARRPAGARAVAPRRPADGLPRRRRRRLSRPRRHLGAGPVVLLGHAASQRRLHAQGDFRHHRRHPAQPDDLPAAIHADGADSDDQRRAGRLFFRPARRPGQDRRRPRLRRLGGRRHRG